MQQMILNIASYLEGKGLKGHVSGGRLSHPSFLSGLLIKIKITFIYKGTVNRELAEWSPH